VLGWGAKQVHTANIGTGDGLAASHQNTLTGIPFSDIQEGPGNVCVCVCVEGGEVRDDVSSVIS